jgi:hypothetical protein
VTTETELTGAELDQALAAALVAFYTDCHPYSGAANQTTGFWMGLLPRVPNHIRVQSPDQRFFKHPSTDVAEAFRLAVWLVDNRDWTIVIELDSRDAFVVCFTPDDGEGSVVSKNPAEAICRSIVLAVQDEADPDVGLEVRPEIVEQLEASRGKPRSEYVTAEEWEPSSW